MTFVRALVRLAALWIAAAPGCAPGVSVAVAPEVAARRPARELRLPAIYKGDPRHLPLSVIAVTLTDAPFEYGYEVSYEREDVGGFIGHLNPLMLFGYPAGRSRAVVVATLIARDAGIVVKRYEATVTASQVRTLYSSDDLGELRLHALRAARDSIEAQIQLDRQFLEELLEHDAAGDAHSSEARP